MAATKIISNSERSKTRKIELIVNSVFLTLTWVCLGLFLELNGPTFKDLQIKTGGSTEEISRAITGRSVGTFLGAVFGGLMVEMFEGYANLMVGLSLSTASVVTAIAPWSPNPNVYWAISMFQGLCEGVTDIAGHRLILTMWKEKAASPLHALHLGFGIGSLIGPLLANPFLAVLDSSESTTINSTNVTTQQIFMITEINASRFNSSLNTLVPVNLTTSDYSIQTKQYIRESRIEVVYTVVAVFTACISLAFYFFQFCFHTKTILSKHDEAKEKQKIRKLLKESVDPANCTGGQRLFGIQIFILLFSFFFNAIGDERMYGKFIRNFSIDQLHMYGDDASLLNSCFWICITLGRFVGFVVSRWIPIRHLILIEVFGVLLSSAILNIFANNNIVMLWVCTVFIGFFLAPLIPSGIAWGDYYVRMSGLAIMFTLQGGSLGSLCYLWVIGHTYEKYGYRVFLFQVVAGGILLVIIASVMTFIGRKHGTRYEQKDIEIHVKNVTEKDDTEETYQVTKF